MIQARICCFGENAGTVGNQDSLNLYRPPRFCPACSGELVLASPHPVCSRCGLVFYRNPLPAVILVLIREGRILTAKRARPPAMGELCLPGGFIDLGESPAEAAARELREETLLTGGSFNRLTTCSRQYASEWPMTALRRHIRYQWHPGSI